MTSTFSNLWSFVSWTPSLSLANSENENTIHEDFEIVDRKDFIEQNNEEEFVRLLPSRSEQAQALKQHLFKYNASSSYSANKIVKYDYIEHAQPDEDEENVKVHFRLKHQKSKHSKKSHHQSRSMKMNNRQSRELRNVPVQDIIKQTNYEKHSVYKLRDKFTSKHKMVFRDAKAHLISFKE